MKKIIVAPSILSANFGYLNEELKKVEEAGADWIHFDVMDGHFVPNISFGVPVLKSISKSHTLINDVHLMISEPLKYIKPFAEAGADYLTFHYEVCKDDKEVDQVIDLIHSYNKKAGISVKPKTDVKSIYPFLTKLELVLIMSVEPGFGGQSFIPNALTQISNLRTYLDENNLHNVIIEVDGGINKETGKQCIEAGVDALVAGSYLFGKDDIKERIKGLKN